MIVCTPEQIRPLTECAVSAFERAADELYDPVDAARGYVEMTDRRGERAAGRSGDDLDRRGAVDAPPATATPGRWSAAASEMKTVAKTQPGSYVAIDRRREHDTGRLVDRGAGGREDERIA